MFRQGIRSQSTHKPIIPMTSSCHTSKRFSSCNTDTEDSGNLNNKLVQYLGHGDLFAHGMVCYPDARYHGSSVFRSPFGLRTGIQTTILIPVRYSDAQYHGTGHLNSKPFEYRTS